MKPFIKTTNQFTNLIFLVIGTCVGVIGSYMYYGTSEVISKDQSTRDISGNYQFIEPLLECENTNSITIKRYLPFEKNLKKEILDLQEKNYPGTHLSFYFRDLHNGPWFSNNNEEGFYPASLLKMPILIAYVKWVESHPEILKEKIKIEEYITYTQNIIPEKYAQVGKEYSIEELIELMIIYSDNNASSNLLVHLPNTIEANVFSTLQIPSPNDSTANDYKLTVTEYASFFRILFNASYLSNAGSEGTLNLLSKVTFSRGITGKLPKNIKVAHKFGERIYEEVSESGTKEIKAQLHDCGIVYYPNSPYLICIMTEGKNLEQLSEMTQDVSKLIYDTVEKNTLNNRKDL